MQIIQRGLVFDSAARTPEKRATAFTGLCKMESGTLLSAFQVGAAKHGPATTIGLCRSRDGGVTWNPLAVSFPRHLNGTPGSFAGGELLEAEPGRLMLCTTWFDRSDPSRPLFDEVTEGVLPAKLLLAFSDDEGDTWSPWQQLPTGELRGCAHCGPLIRWNDGTIAVPFESYKEWDDPRPHRHAAWVVVSQDAGRTFSEPTLVAQHPEHRIYYWDQRLCALPSPGDFLALFWTHDLGSKQDLQVHLQQGSIHGAKASAPRSTGITGQIAAPAVLDDGRWLAFIVDRSGPNTMKLWVSHDEGLTWPAENSHCVYNHDEQAKLTQELHDVDYKQYWGDMLKWTFGHPAMLVLDNNELLLSFYAGSPGCTSVHWVRARI